MDCTSVYKESNHKHYTLCHSFWISLVNESDNYVLDSELILPFTRSRKHYVYLFRSAMAFCSSGRPFSTVHRSISTTHTA